MKELYRLAWEKGVLRSAAMTFIYTAIFGILSRPLAGFTTRGWLFYVLGVSLGLSALTIAVMIAIAKSENKRQKHSS